MKCIKIYDEDYEKLEKIKALRGTTFAEIIHELIENGNIENPIQEIKMLLYEILNILKKEKFNPPLQ